MPPPCALAGALSDVAQLCKVLDEEESADVVNAILGDSEYVLHKAVREGNCDVVRELLRRGAVTTCRTGMEETPLHLAAQILHADLASLLISFGADVNARDARNWSPLMCAALRGAVDVMRVLLASGATVESEDWGHFEEKPLDMALRSGSIPAMRLLIENGGCVRRESHDGILHLHRACKYQFLHVIDFLVSECGVDVNCCDHNEDTAVHLCAQMGLVGSLRTLLRHNAGVNVRNWAGSAPLHCSLSGGAECMRELLKSGANPEATDAEGRTALDLVCAEGVVEGARALIAVGSPLTRFDSCLTSPLITASRCEHIGMVTFLLDSGANPMMPAGDGVVAIGAAPSTRCGAEIVRNVLAHVCIESSSCCQV